MVRGKRIVYCLSEDVVYEILLRLPVTSIYRFKSVCKGWYDVIKSNRFRRDHFALQSNSALILRPRYDQNDEQNVHRYQHVGPGRNLGCNVLSLSGETLTVVKDIYITLPIPPVHDYFIMTCQCRGSFLLDDVEATYGDHFGVWNPMTGAFSSLHSAPVMENLRKFQPEICDYGLGWDSSTNTYKVVCLLYDRGTAQVYTLGSGSWRLIDSPVPKLPPSTILCSHHSLHVHGFCYWRFVLRLENSNNCSCTIVSFDVAREVFATIALPHDVIVSAHDDVSLDAYCDLLACLVPSTGCFEVWVLEQQQHQQWTKVFNIRDVCSDIIEFGIWNDTHLFVTKMEETHHKKILLYDLNSDHVEERETDDNIGSVFLNYKTSLFLD